jgi:hypothetical protein
MSELTLTVFRLGMVILLWFFVFSVVGVLRSDLYGTRISRRGQRRAARAASNRPKAPAGIAAPLPTGAPGAPGTPGAPAPASQQQSANPAVPQGKPGAAYRGGNGIPSLLVVTEGRLAGTSLPLPAAGVLIGRNPECALVLDDDFASGRHARVFNRAGVWHAEDLGSTNGTFLDGARLTTAQPLRVGATMRIGRTVIEVRG